MDWTQGEQFPEYKESDLSFPHCEQGIQDHTSVAVQYLPRQLVCTAGHKVIFSSHIWHGFHIGGIMGHCKVTAV